MNSPAARRSGTGSVVALVAARALRSDVSEVRARRPEDAVTSPAQRSLVQEHHPRADRRRGHSLPEAHVAAVVRDAVEQLRPAEVGGRPSRFGTTIGPLETPDERRLTALLVHGYSHGVLSSRALEGAIVTDPIARFLAGRPRHHEALRAFRRTHRVALVNVFVDVYRMCRAAGLTRIGQVELVTTRLAALDPEPRSATALAQEAEALLSRAEQEDREDDVLFAVSRRDPSRSAETDQTEPSGARLRAVLRLLDTRPRARS